MFTKQPTFILLFILCLQLSQAQYKPCSLYLFDEVGCVSSTFEKCSWNDFLSACQSTESTNIGCSPTLNRLACINQLQYPNQEWAYCRFSGYCRSLTDSLACNPNLSQPACLSVMTKACLWNGVCQEMTDVQFQAGVVAAQSDVTQMNQANILICTRMVGKATVHQSGAFSFINQLIDQYGSDANLLTKYRALLTIPGCLEVDSNLLSVLVCQTGGLNAKACSSITTPRQKCQFINNQCTFVNDFSTLNCSDIINKETCLSITNVKQPCYWNNGCQMYTGKADCNTNVSPVSPSFCAAVNYTDVNGKEQECFYYEKKQKCSQLCRQSSLSNQKSCNSSSYNCTFQNQQCQFAGVTSQCGLLGQNKYSCMQVSENCQFVKGVCIKITDLSTQKCIDHLNQQACVNLTASGQLCIYEPKLKQCQNLKLSFYQTCDGLNNVNENVCRRITDSACYWVNGNCSVADPKISCTAKGLNKIGCLASSIGPCQWSKEAGQCQNINILTNQTSCESLKLVNEYSCRMVQFLESNAEQRCKYNSLLNQCEKFEKEVAPLATYAIQCSTLGLNKQGCLDVADPTVACKWTSQGCTQLTTISSSCSGLINVTSKACALVKGEICAFDSKQFRCTSSVIKTTKTCNIADDKDETQLVLNGKACAFIEPKSDMKCYFDSTNLNCVEATPALLNVLECANSFPNKLACLAITTPGQRCQWNTYKKQCEQYKVPTYDYCDNIKNAGVNLCIGYESDTSYYIDSSSYCTNNDPPNQECALFLDTTSNTDCFSAATQPPNLHACVALTAGQNCYFDISKFKCTKVESADLPSIYNSIKCKQANKDICLNITTLDQFCDWDDDQKKCYDYNKCQDQNDAPGCKAVKQPCVFKENTCTQITSSNAQDYDCLNANDNEFACLMVAKGPCKYDSSACVELTQDLDNDDCTTYSSIEVNAISCAKITKDGAKCKYDLIKNTCIQEDSVSDECNFGQNESNCLQENSCYFNKETFVCSKVDTPCNTALTLQDCMNAQYYCIWKANKCSIAPDLSCLEYNQPDTKYSSYTCGSVYASVDTKICAQNSDTYLCEEIVGVKCTSTTDHTDCTNIKNNCKWSIDKCLTNLVTATKCTDNFTQYSCFTGNLYCFWNLTELKCEDYDYQVEISCQKINGSEIENPVDPVLSQELCYYNYCYLDKETMKCTEDNSTPTECTEAVSPFGCKSLDDSKHCYWDTDSKCKALADLSQGKNLTYRQVSNSQQTLCSLPENEGELTEWYEGYCYSVDSNVSLCSDLINIRACEAVINDTPIQQCIYKDSKCQYADLTTALCTDTINIYTCVSITTPDQYCVWLGQKCSNLTDDGFTVGKYSSVNQNSCLKTYTINGAPSSTITNPQGVKYSQNGCVLSDPDVDTCDTPGLNYYGCLQTKAGSCFWNGKKCAVFTSFDGKTQCSDYTMVSAGVCVSVPNLNCTWRNYNCISAPTTTFCENSLSQEACIAQQDAACGWINNKCQTQIILSGVTRCNDPSAPSTTATFSSIYTCAQIQYGALPCSHSGTGCTTTLIIQAITCSSPGLNDVACTMVTSEKCQFFNGKCQSYDGNSQQCRQLSQVSPQVCADITDSTQNCKFSRLNNKCTSVYNYDLCISEGLNSAGCNSLSVCKWHKDQKYCACASDIKGVTFCVDQDYNTCQIQSQKCKWDETIQSCRARLCSDLDSTNCKNANKNNQACYLTTSGTCSGASTCVGVKNAANCTDITIKGKICQSSNTYCRDPSCEDNIDDVTCGGVCYWTGSYCTERTCQTFSKKEQCSGTYDDGTCFWINNYCIGMDSCYSLMLSYTDQDALAKACNASTVKGNQCYWQKAYQYSDSYECSHNQCKPLGSSQINCVGAEIKDFVCILAHDFSCIRCEDITNSCECGKYQGNCVYINNKCRSVQCDSYVEESCALYPEKCIWHTDSKQCLIICSKLDQSSCQQRQTLTQQCYWDSKLSRCNNGTPTVIIIDTVSEQIQQANITITVASNIQIQHHLGIILFLILI